MLKKLTIIAIALILVIPVIGNAKDLTGRFSLGYFDSDAPVGFRYWVNDKIGLDLGLGFESVDLGEENGTSFWVEAGVPYVVYPTDRANFFIRPGVVFASLDNRVYGSGPLDEKWTVFTILLTPGAEVFFGDHFSLQAAHGFALRITSPPDEISDESSTDFSSIAASVTTIGFHFYF
ncbi:MAG TPA: hypothetical protein ENO22_03325 [candidate division Zixibacteria bacterium]|nr:hypothetical protein [candidate division Zixibacteria bacterium]